MNDSLKNIFTVSDLRNRVLFTLGLLANRVVDLWALAAAAFLIVWIYVPPLARPLGLVPVPFLTLAAVAAAVVAWIALVEAWKAASGLREARPR